MSGHLKGSSPKIPPTAFAVRAAAQQIASLHLSPVLDAFQTFNPCGPAPALGSCARFSLERSRMNKQHALPCPRTLGFWSLEVDHGA